MHHSLALTVIDVPTSIYTSILGQVRASPHLYSATAPTGHFRKHLKEHETNAARRPRPQTPLVWQQQPIHPKDQYPQSRTAMFCAPL